jgi:hypothetical protein
MTIKPLKTQTQPKTAEAVAKGGHKPVNTPDAGKQPVHEPYGKAPKADEPAGNPARPDGAGGS